jgi:branched-subunit amino acid aminotransferase/4-amino-4-deoxychorismate lyase
MPDASAAGPLAWPQPKSTLPDRPLDPRFAAGSAYVDGAFCPIEEARIPQLDWGFLRSDACQETISAWDGAFFRLTDHLELCNAIGIAAAEGALTPEQVRAAACPPGDDITAEEQESAEREGIFACR